MLRERAREHDRHLGVVGPAERLPLPDPEDLPHGPPDHAALERRADRIAERETEEAPDKPVFEGRHGR